MAILIDADMGDDDEVMCSECDAVFTVIFRRSATCVGIVYCPFCGDEIVDETTDEEDDGRGSNGFAGDDLIAGFSNGE